MKILSILKAFSQKKIVWALAIALALLVTGLPQTYQAQGIPVVEEREPNNDFMTAQRIRRFPTVVRGTSLAVTPGEDFLFVLNLGGGFFEPLPDFYQLVTRSRTPGQTLVVNLAFASSPVFPSFGGELQIFDPIPPLGLGFGAGSSPIGGGLNICDIFTFFSLIPPCNSDLDMFLFQSSGGALLFVGFSANGLPTSEIVTAPIPEGLTNFFLLIGDFGPTAVDLTNAIFGTGFVLEAGTPVPYSLKLQTRGLPGGGGGEDIVQPAGKIGRVEVATLTRVDRALTVSGVELKEVYHLRLDQPELVRLNLTSSSGKAGSIYLLRQSDSELIGTSRSIRPELSRTQAIALDAGDYLIGVRKPDAPDAVYALTASDAESGEILAARVTMGAQFYLESKGLTQADLEEAAQKFQQYLSRR